MKNKKLIQKFIEDNKLDFTSNDSALNGNCVVIAGYACYLDFEEDEFIDAIKEALPDVVFDDDINPAPKPVLTLEDELRRVFNYAYNNNYGDWWTYRKAKDMYKF